MKNQFWYRLAISTLSILFLSMGWLGESGIPLLGALVPLLHISYEAKDNRADWWCTFGWALYIFLGWNLATTWWVAYASPLGTIAGSITSTCYSMLAFMIYHTISKRAHKALAYTALVSLWISLEYNYTVSDFSWPWLLLGNGFSNDIWAIQWYEYTGIFGGTLWILISNLLLYETTISGFNNKKGYTSAGLILMPIIISAFMFNAYEPNKECGTAEVTVIQPNIDCYMKFAGSERMQENNIIELLGEVPSTTQLILLPETSVPRHYWKNSYLRSPFFKRLSDTLQSAAPRATLIAGANMMQAYKVGEQSRTARIFPDSNGYYDMYNSAVSIAHARGGEVKSEYRDKGRLVIGVENTPTWIFDICKFFVVDLGGIVGQLGIGESGEVFTVEDSGAKVGAAICYEGLYGNFYGDFVRNGAEFMAIISNDGWWGDTPGHRHLYTFSAIRAVEHRRAIARSANTGISGFIDSRGVSIKRMNWNERGVLSYDVELNDKITLYTRYGDYIARIASFVAALSLLYYIAYRARKRHRLVD